MNKQYRDLQKTLKHAAPNQKRAIKEAMACMRGAKRSRKK